MGFTSYFLALTDVWHCIFFPTKGLRKNNSTVFCILSGKCLVKFWTTSVYIWLLWRKRERGSKTAAKVDFLIYCNSKLTSCDLFMKLMRNILFWAFRKFWRKVCGVLNVMKLVKLAMTSKILIIFDFIFGNISHEG